VSTSYFVHGVYGVLPTGPIFDRFLALIEESLPEAEEDEELPRDEMMNTAAEQVFQQHPDLAHELKEQYQAPDGCRMIWTGDDDNRPGECAADPEVWVYGVGLFAMPIKETISARFQDEAEWHTWVTSG
jgi:hypothetical protein